MYQITYIMRFCLGSILFLVVNRMFPPRGLAIAEDFNHEASVIEGVAVSLGSENGADEAITITA